VHTTIVQRRHRIRSASQTESRSLHVASLSMPTQAIATTTTTSSRVGTVRVCRRSCRQRHRLSWAGWSPVTDYESPLALLQTLHLSGPLPLIGCPPSSTPPGPARRARGRRSSTSSCCPRLLHATRLPLGPALLLPRLDLPTPVALARPSPACPAPPWSRLERTQSRRWTRTTSSIRARAAARYPRPSAPRRPPIADVRPDSRGRKGL